MNHYTNRVGYNGIRSQPAWKFVANKPTPTHQPEGCYFTTYEPDEPELSNRLFVPREKLAFIFAFRDDGDLLPLPGGRGRLRRVFYSPTDYVVERSRQLHHGETGL